MKRPRTGAGHGWSCIPEELLDEISGHLSTDADLLHIHQVCAHWRACTSPPAAFRPWIVGRRTAWSRLPTTQADYSLWLPRRLFQRKVEIGAAPAGLPYCRGASRGWLALSDRAQAATRLVLWDPISGTEIPLPPLGSLVQVYLSGDPLASPDWMAVASQRYGNEGATQTFFWRPGDAAWSFLSERRTGAIGSIAFHGGRIFYLDRMRILAICDLNLGAAGVQMRYLGNSMNRLCRCDRFHIVDGAYMVVCAGELLLVVLRNDRGHPLFCEIYKLVWRPDSEVLLEPGERVWDLGEHSLFLGRGESFALSAKEFPTVKRNHVYGLHHVWTHSRKDWAFVFDLGSAALKEIPYPQELREDGTNWWPIFWFCLRTPFVKQ